MAISLAILSLQVNTVVRYRWRKTWRFLLKSPKYKHVEASTYKHVNVDKAIAGIKCLSIFTSLITTKTHKMTRRQLAKKKLEELKKELSFEIKLMGITTGENKLLTEVNVFTLSVQIDALEAYINFK